jgi:hypothetical protein
MGIYFSRDAPPHLPQKASALALSPTKYEESEPKACRMHISSAYLGKDYKPDVALFIDF